MRKDNEQLNDILHHEYTKKTNYYTHSEVPENVTFEIDGYLLKVKYTKELVIEPLNNINSFEGWMMVFRRWGVFDKIQFCWEQPKDTLSPIYLQFIDRVQFFHRNFSNWFQLASIAHAQINNFEVSTNLDNKKVIESIIDICWLYETEEKLSITIPDKWDLLLKDGVVEITPHFNRYGIEGSLEGDETSIYTPWQLLINRWAYLPTSPQSSQNDLTTWSDMSDDVQNLIKVGFTERNFPFPAEY